MNYQKDDYQNDSLTRECPWGSTLAQQGAQTDLVKYALAGNGLGEHPDHKAEHGGTTVTQLGGPQLFGMDLSGGGVLKPAGVRLGGTGHGEFQRITNSL